MTIYVVTDLSYGDSGKGTTVDFLSRQGKSVVVRHNGGPQAQHNVITDGGQHHCFAQFGSGTLAGAKTFLSRFMLINPASMINEAEHLAALGYDDVWSRTFVDEDCKLITSWHVAVNRLRELSRGNSRHGSCGQGVGVCMEQDIDRPDLTVRVKDIGSPNFAARLDELRRFLYGLAADVSGPSIIAELSDAEQSNWSVLDDDTLSEHFTSRCRDWVIRPHIVRSGDPMLRLMIHGHDNIIFEGAQGVLLDEWYGFHPYTTWSTTTHENALTLLKEAHYDVEDVTRLGVIRAVTTRHGPGPHPTEDVYLTAKWLERHNGTGRWQGPMRVGHLDLVAHRYAATVCGGVDKVVVTHLDCGDEWLYCEQYNQVRDIPVGVKGDLDTQARITNIVRSCTPQLVQAGGDADLLDAIEANLGPIGIMSYGPTAHEKHILLDNLSRTELIT